MDFKAEAKKMAADKLKSYGGESKGGWAKSSESSVKTASRKGYATGGIVDGGTSPPRMDRPAGGGKKGAGTVVNIIVGKDENAPPQGAMPPPMPMAPPRPSMPPAPPMAGPPGMPPGGPPMGAGGPPPGMMGGKPPMMPPPGMPPMGHASGGRVGYKDGGNVSKEISDVKKSLPKTSAPKSTSMAPKLDGGGAGATARLEKIKDYGTRSS